MTISKILANFSRDESGAVTVDWVMLTAAIVLIGVVAMVVISNQLDLAGDSIVVAIEASVS